MIPLGDARRTTGKGGHAPGVLHSRGDRGYSLARLVQGLQRGDVKALAPYEWAVHEKLAGAGHQPAGRGVMVPTGENLYRLPGHEQEIEALSVELKQALVFDADAEDLLVARRYHAKAMDPLDGSAGGSTVGFPSMGETIRLLRPNPAMAAAGARVVALPPQGSISFPTTTGDPTFEWIGPNQSLTPSDAGTGFVTMASKLVGGLIVLPNDLVRYSLGAAEAMVRR